MSTEKQPPSWRKISWQIYLLCLLGAVGLTVLLSAFKPRSWVALFNWNRIALLPHDARLLEPTGNTIQSLLLLPNGRPILYPLPKAQEVWQCEVAVVGGSLGGVAAASHAMKSGAKTCLIELTPWLGGQLSSQGVSAIDESYSLIRDGGLSQSWIAFKNLIERLPVKLPAWAKQTKPLSVKNINSCWVGLLCFPPAVGAQASQLLLQSSVKSAPGSRWGTSIAFKGADFDETGRFITAIHAVKRIPLNRTYMPQGRLSQELSTWYSWSPDRVFQKVPIRLEAPAGKRLIVIDATDTGELVAWARIPHRVGSESRQTTGEVHAAKRDNPDCTQAFTFPFAMAIKNDGGKSLAALAKLEPVYSKEEHRREYSLIGFPMFSGNRSFFKYRRIVSIRNDARFWGPPAPGDITLVNWERGNNWKLMDPPLILTEEKLRETGQYQNWMGGLSLSALKHAENHALLFSQWLMETQRDPKFPLAHLSGADSPMGTLSGLSMMPYIREGRRILGREAYGQKEFMIREGDIRKDMPGSRNFNTTAVGITHYDIDIQGCRYRNWQKSWEAESASVKGDIVRPTVIPIESLIPQGVDNLLIGGKSIAVTHIVNGVTRIHKSEWATGAAAGATAGWLLKHNKSDVMPAAIAPKKLMPKLQEFLKKQGLRFD